MLFRSLPDGALTGNGIDEVLLHEAGVASYSNARPIVRDTALRARGIPYRVGAEGTRDALIRVGDGRSDTPGTALLVIEPGVTVRFNPIGSNAGFLVQGHPVGGSWVPQGALRAEGTPSLPITLTSARAAPAAGDWTGLYFKDVIDPRTVVRHATIAFAGGDSGQQIGRAHV